MRSEETEKPASTRSLAGECLSDRRADNSDNNNIMDQDIVSCKAELSEGLTEFLLKKIIQLRARLQPEFSLSEQGEAQVPRLPVGSAMGIA